MKFTKTQIRKLIRESITSRIKKMTPYDRAMRYLHHAYQDPLEQPEDAIKNRDYYEKISTVRSASGEDEQGSPDELAWSLPDASEKPHFAPNPDMSFEELRDKSKEQKAAAYFEYVDEESAFLEIEYRFRWIEEYEMKQRGIRYDQKQRPPDLIANSRLAEMQDELYDSKNVLKYHTDIHDYISNPAYASERAKLTQAFNDTPTDSLNNPSKPWKPKSWFTYVSNGTENTLEEFLKEKAERLLSTAISTAY